MPTKDLFQSMLAFLNFPENVSVVKVRKFLQDEGLCQDELILGDEENTIYSLYSQKEVEARKARGEPVSLSLLQAMKPVEDGKTYSLLTDPAYYRERVIFPDADEGAALKQAFSSHNLQLKKGKLPTIGVAVACLFRNPLGRFLRCAELTLHTYNLTHS